VADGTTPTPGCAHVWGHDMVFGDAFPFTTSEIWSPEDTIQQCASCREIRTAPPAPSGSGGQTSRRAPAQVSNVIDMAEFARRRDERALAYFCAVQDAARQMRVTVVPDVHEDKVIDVLKVDASALDLTGLGIIVWYLWPSDDDPALWHHPQSHPDQFFPLSDVLLGIASVYVELDPVAPDA
jgi:hypothetical protein